MRIAPRRRSLSDFYRARYPLACWISIAVVSHSLDHSLFTHLTSYIRRKSDIQGIATWRRSLSHSLFAHLISYKILNAYSLALRITNLNRNGR